MGTRQVTRRSPSGDVVRLTWEGADAASEVWGVRFAGGSYGRGFQIHPRGAHDTLVALDAGARTRRTIVGRHEVQVATTTDGSSTTATLIGAHHELMTVFVGPAPTPARLDGLFGVLDVDDAKEGMRVVPHRATFLSVFGEHHVLVTDDVLSLDVPAPAHAGQMVPSHRGHRSRHGEIWKTPLPGRTGKRARDYAYVVGTPTGAAQVVAGDVDATTDERVLTLVNSLDVAWSAGR